MATATGQSEGGPVLGVLRALWLYRSLVAGLARREFQVRSVRALWGHAWLIIHPAVQILLYTFVFAGVLGARLPGSVDPLGYGLFLCAGVIHWNFFQEGVFRYQAMFFVHADLMKTLRVPRSVLPAAVTFAGLTQHAIVVVVFLIVLGLVGRWPGWALLWALPLIALQITLAAGLGILTGTLNVFFRDVAQATTTGLQLLFWLTPIVYPLSILPEWVRSAIQFNPLTPIMVGYQSIVLQARSPDLDTLIGPTIGAVSLAIVSWIVFRALGSDLVDEL